MKKPRSKEDEICFINRPNGSTYLEEKSVLRSEATAVSGPGAEARNSIGIVLVTGMVVGTLFTLIVVPVFYSLLASKHRHVENAEEEPRTPALPSPQPTAA